MSVLPVPVRLGVCLLALLGMGACAPALNWREFVLDGSDGLQVRFPCKPEMAERPVHWPDSGATLTVRMHQCQADGMTWVLQSAVVGSVDAVVPTLRAWPTVLQNNLRLATHGRVLDVRTPALIAVPHMTPSPVASAVDLAAEPAPGAPDQRWRRVRAWHFSHGLRVFEAAVWSIEDHKPAQTSEDVALPFFDGLHFPG
ncbi:MAG: hypothetical protein RI920_1942 [Pseudomonadota bacterium]